MEGFLVLGSEVIGEASFSHKPTAQDGVWEKRGEVFLVTIVTIGRKRGVADEPG